MRAAGEQRGHANGAREPGSATRERHERAGGFRAAGADADQELVDDVKALAGALYIAESGLQSVDEARRAQAEWTPKRVGFNAPESARSVRSDVQRAVYAACGIPLALVDSQPGAQAVNQR